MLIDCHNHVGIELGQYLCNNYPYGQHLDDLVHTGVSNNIDRWIVFPMVTNFALNLDALRSGRVSSDGALENVPYEFENRRLLREIYDVFPEPGKQIIPFVMFDPGRNTQQQAVALRALREQYTFLGMKTQTTMLESEIKNLLHGGKVFLELAREWDLPILIHSSVIPSDKWAQAMDILDIAELNPDIRFCLAHSCRFDASCLDRLATLPNCWFDCSAHGIHCDFALLDSPVIAPRERRFDTDYSQPARVLHDLASAYPSKLLWGSDAPYHSFAGVIENEHVTMLSSYELEAGYLHALPNELKHHVAYLNTLAFLGNPSRSRFDITTSVEAHS